MDNGRLAIVTGAFGYTGRYITEILLNKGWRVKNLTGHADRTDPFNGRVAVIPFEFERPGLLAKKIEGADAVFNTYWVRFNYKRTTYGRAVANVQNLMRVAAEAGVKRFVHISIANPDEKAAWGYYRGKAAMEKTLMETNPSYAIVRPTVLFGGRDVLFNNIAWFLRKLPVFAIPGLGDYRLQPVHVKDTASLAVELCEREDNIIKDAVGPETYSYEELVYMIRGAVKSRARVVRVPPNVALLLAAIMGPFLGDRVISRLEMRELMNDRLATSGPATCSTRFSIWLEKHGGDLGLEYASELKRHFV